MEEKALVYSDVILEYFTNSRGFGEDVKKLLEMASQNEIDAYFMKEGLNKVREHLSLADPLSAEQAFFGLQTLIGNRIVEVKPEIIKDASKYDLASEAAIATSLAKSMGIDNIITFQPMLFTIANFKILNIREFNEKRLEIHKKNLENNFRINDRTISSLNHVYSLNKQEIYLNLNDWLNQNFESDWQPLDAVLVTTYRSIDRVLDSTIFSDLDDVIYRVKKISSIGIALVVGLKTNDSLQRAIKLQVHPTSHNHYLPSNIFMAIFDNQGNRKVEVLSRDIDNYLQVIAYGISGQAFSVEISYRNASIIERFLL